MTFFFRVNVSNYNVLRLTFYALLNVKLHQAFFYIFSVNKLTNNQKIVFLFGHSLILLLSFASVLFNYIQVRIMLINIISSDSSVRFDGDLYKGIFKEYNLYLAF